MEDEFNLEGDIDTNACVMEGMIGAKFGIDILPEDYVDKIIYSIQSQVLITGQKSNTKGID